MRIGKGRRRVWTEERRKQRRVGFEVNGKGREMMERKPRVREIKRSEGSGLMRTRRAMGGEERCRVWEEAVLARKNMKNKDYGRRKEVAVGRR
ncbi:protocadherin-12 [Corchorus olitorius]|uniref:Protocadherin-12 n=1 Tax=Corchorus olitorius TaxID=93759 RepID=A0A1R3KMK4_9ROSI|nr:protocadherin-12 [Corchorus olitorius]